MKIYIFKSDANSELRAFAGDLKAIKLPEQFGKLPGGRRVTALLWQTLTGIELECHLANRQTDINAVTDIWEVTLDGHSAGQADE